MGDSGVTKTFPTLRLSHSQQPQISCSFGRRGVGVSCRGSTQQETFHISPVRTNYPSISLETSIVLPLFFCGSSDFLISQQRNEGLAWSSDRSGVSGTAGLPHRSRQLPAQQAHG